jgi:hypothetical protein
MIKKFTITVKNNFVKVFYPIVASDSVTYVVTANGFHSNDTVTVVIAVGVGTANLALRKHATQFCLMRLIE